jgi:hypothetical protein
MPDHGDTYEWSEQEEAVVERFGPYMRKRVEQEPEQPHIIGYLCPAHPEGLMKPTPFEDPCGHDKAVWSDGTMTDA